METNMLLLLWACSPVTIDKEPTICEEVVETEDTDEILDTAEDTDNEQEELDLIWSQATLEVLSPEAAAFVALGEETLFDAVILDEEGNELVFTDIEWSTSEDNSWQYTANSFYDTLIAGRHAITAQARLPNGDRLTYVVGGVLVQHPNAGIYAGTTSIDVTINYDTPIIVSCSGGVTVTVDPTGEMGIGEGDCIVNINGGDIPSTYIFDLEIEENNVGGTAALDLWLIQQQFDLVGTVAQGELTATWSDVLFNGYIEVSGTLNLTRVSLY
jgi:hypothetical protein